VKLPRGTETLYIGTPPRTHQGVSEVKRHFTVADLAVIEERAMTSGESPAAVIESIVSSWCADQRREKCIAGICGHGSKCGRKKRLESLEDKEDGRRDRHRTKQLATTVPETPTPRVPE